MDQARMSVIVSSPDNYYSNKSFTTATKGSSPIEDFLKIHFIFIFIGFSFLQKYSEKPYLPNHEVSKFKVHESCFRYTQRKSNIEIHLAHMGQLTPLRKSMFHQRGKLRFTLQNLKLGQMHLTLIVISVVSYNRPSNMELN